MQDANAKPETTELRRVHDAYIKNLTESVAIALWHRFAPDHSMTWNDETHKAEYRQAAVTVIGLCK